MALVLGGGTTGSCRAFNRGNKIASCWARGCIRGRKFLTCGIDTGATDKLKTCRHGGQHSSCRTGLAVSPFSLRNHLARRRSKSASDPTTREITLASEVGSISGTEVTWNVAENAPSLLS